MTCAPNTPSEVVFLSEIHAVRFPLNYPTAGRRPKKGGASKGSAALIPFQDQFSCQIRSVHPLRDLEQHSFLLRIQNGYPLLENPVLLGEGCPLGYAADVALKHFEAAF